MKGKLIGIFICMMLMTPAFTIATHIENIPALSQTTSQAPLLFDEDVPVPVWKVNDYWEYKIDTVTFDLDEPEFSFHIKLWTEKLSLTVTEVTDDSYTTQVEGTLNGNGSVYMLFPDGPVSATAELTNTKLIGIVGFNKSDLGITSIHATLDGRIKLRIIENPYIPIQIPFPFSARIELRVNSSVPYPLIAFPFNTTKIWGLPATNISVDGTIESPWLNLINRLNNIAQRRWGLVEIILKVIEFIIKAPIDPDLVRQLSDILADILPVVDIRHVLTTYVGFEPEFVFPEVPEIFFVNNTETITVCAGTFFVYHIPVAGGLGSLYYAPEAGNIVKVTGRFEDVIPFVNDITLELCKTNYQP
jgi:hypothetical protein